MNVINRATNYIKTNGLKKGIIRLTEKMTESNDKRNRSKLEQLSYLKWIENNEPSEETFVE